MNVLDEILQELRTLRTEHAQLKGLVERMTKVSTDDEPMTVNEAAQLLRISPHTLRKRCAQGVIPYSSARPGSKLYFIRSQLIKYIESNTKRTAAEEARELMKRGRRTK